MLTHQELATVLRYDPETGKFVWIVSRSHRIKVGQEAGCARHDGRWVIRIGDRLYLRSRLAFFYMMQRWPTPEVDHIDQDGTNDRWYNLREVTPSQNRANGSASSRSMYRGVYFRPDKKRKQWAARIKVNRKERYIGYYLTPEEAARAYDAAAIKEFGQFAHPNFATGA